MSAVVGAFARVERAVRERVLARLEELPGVSTFDVQSPDKVGLLLEAEDPDAAHAVLVRQVRGVEGVLGVWPVSLHFDPAMNNTR